MEEITWGRTGGYEVSSRGDRRFSALYATLDDGRTIEAHYQCDVKGHALGSSNWRLGKGKPPLDPATDTWGEYLALWRRWAAAHPELMQELRLRARNYDNRLSDCFASTLINQARALATLLNEM